MSVGSNVLQSTIVTFATNLPALSYPWFLYDQVQIWKKHTAALTNVQTPTTIYTQKLTVPSWADSLGQWELQTWLALCVSSQPSLSSLSVSLHGHATCSYSNTPHYLCTSQIMDDWPIRFSNNAIFMEFLLINECTCEIIATWFSSKHWIN